MHESLGKPCKYRLMFKTLSLSRKADCENKLVYKTIGGQSNQARFRCYCVRPQTLPGNNSFRHWRDDPKPHVN